jgi:20S proteasome alpha/beta subunit
MRAAGSVIAGNREQGTGNRDQGSRIRLQGAAISPLRIIHLTKASFTGLIRDESLFTQKRRRRKEDFPVTVCIAAIYEGSGIVGASDRMLTAGDVQFEPSTPKIRFYTNSIGSLIAGDANLQAEINSEVWIKTKEIILQSTAWVKVKDVAMICKKECDKALRGMAERRILDPFGITLAEFMSRQTEFSGDFVRDIGTELLSFEGPLVQTIIAGCDDEGPHIYTVDNDSIQCHDGVGFAAIGAGQAHANSQMMAFSHSFRSSLADTLRAVFFAKKRAEIAPGVGPNTDMMVVVGRGGLSMIADNVQIELENRYAEEKRRQNKVANTTREKIGNFVQGILDKPPTSEQAQLPPPAPESDTSSVGEKPKV